MRWNGRRARVLLGASVIGLLTAGGAAAGIIGWNDESADLPLAVPAAEPVPSSTVVPPEIPPSDERDAAVEAAAERKPDDTVVEDEPVRRQDKIQELSDPEAAKSWYTATTTTVPARGERKDGGAGTKSPGTTKPPPSGAPADPPPTTTPPDTTTTPAPGGPKQDSGPIVVSGESGVVIQGLRISNPGGPCVKIQGSGDVIVRDSEIGPCGDKAVIIEGSSGVTLQRLAIHDAQSGVYAVSSQAVVVADSTFTNAGRNFVQFDKVTGAGNVISGNSGANRLGGSNAEDFISVYKSSGTSGSPIKVVNNHFSNGGPSTSGSGIMVGDLGGSHILVQGNRLVDPGQVGIGVPGGTGIRVIGNVIYSGAHPWSNVGIYVWNQSGGACGSIEVRDNRVEWYAAGGNRNSSWDGGNCGAIAGWDQNDWNADVG